MKKITLNREYKRVLLNAIFDQVKTALESYDDTIQEIVIDSIGCVNYSDFYVKIRLSKDLFRAGDNGNYALMQEPTEDEYNYIIEALSPISCVDIHEVEFELDIEKEEIETFIKIKLK